MKYYYIKEKEKEIYDTLRDAVRELETNMPLDSVIVLENELDLIEHCDAFDLNPYDYCDSLDYYLKDNAIGSVADDYIDILDDLE